MLRCRVPKVAPCPCPPCFYPLMLLAGCAMRLAWTDCISAAAAAAPLIRNCKPWPRCGRSRTARRITPRRPCKWMQHRRTALPAPLPLRGPRCRCATRARMQRGHSHGPRCGKPPHFSLVRHTYAPQLIGADPYVRPLRLWYRGTWHVGCRHRADSCKSMAICWRPRAATAPIVITAVSALGRQKDRASICSVYAWRERTTLSPLPARDDVDVVIESHGRHGRPAKHTTKGAACRLAKMWFQRPTKALLAIHGQALPRRQRPRGASSAF